MNSGPELCLFLSDDSYHQSYVISLHGSAGIKNLQVAQSQIYSQIGQFSRILVPALQSKNPSHKLNILSMIPGFHQDQLC